MFFLNFKLWWRSFILHAIKYQPQSKRSGDVQSLNMSFLYIVLFVFGFFHILKNLGILDMAPFQKNTKWKYLQWLENNTKFLLRK
jgi:hypothetical protein